MKSRILNFLSNLIEKLLESTKPSDISAKKRVEKNLLPLRGQKENREHNYI